MFERPEWWVSQLLFGWLPSLVWLAVIGAPAWVLAKLALDRAVPPLTFSAPCVAALERWSEKRSDRAVASALVLGERDWARPVGGDQPIKSSAQLVFRQLEMLGQGDGQRVHRLRQVRCKELVHGVLASHLLGSMEVIWVTRGDECMPHVQIVRIVVGEHLGE